MSTIYSSGNASVDAMVSVQISGNIIPQEWYRTLRKDNGKPYMLAIIILSDIVYWYRPVEIRDEGTGHVIGWRKKFSDDFLQKSYQQYADFYGESKRSVKAAIDFLEHKGVVRKIFRDIGFESTPTLYNVMFLDLNVEKLMEITYSDSPDAPHEMSRQERSMGSGKILATKDGKMKPLADDSAVESPVLSDPAMGDIVTENSQNREELNMEKPVSDVTFGRNETGSDPESAEISSKTSESGENPSFSAPVPPPTKFCRTPYKKMQEGIQNNVGGPTEKCTPSYEKMYGVLQKNVYPPAENRGTNTENTMEITEENTTEITTETISSGIDRYHQSIYPSIREKTAQTVVGNIGEGRDTAQSESVHPGRYGMTVNRWTISGNPDNSDNGDIARMKADLAQIRQNIRYDELLNSWKMSGQVSPTKIRLYTELYEIISDAICTRSDYLQVGAKQYPMFKVRDRMLQLTDEHLKYVMDCMDHYSGKIENIWNYLFAAIYRAPETLEFYYSAEANREIGEI